MVPPLKESSFRLGVLFRTLGVLCSVLPPLLAILCYFPVWLRRGGDYALCGFTAVLIILAFLPLLRLIRRAAASASAHTVWLVIFLLFLLVSRIADEMVVISFIGFIGNLVGAIMFKLAERAKKDE